MIHNNIKILAIMNILIMHMTTMPIKIGHCHAWLSGACAYDYNLYNNKLLPCMTIRRVILNLQLRPEGYSLDLVAWSTTIEIKDYKVFLRRIWEWKEDLLVIHHNLFSPLGLSAPIVAPSAIIRTRTKKQHKPKIYDIHVELYNYSIQWINITLKHMYINIT